MKKIFKTIIVIVLLIWSFFSFKTGCTGTELASKLKSYELVGNAKNVESESTGYYIMGIVTLIIALKIITGKKKILPTPQQIPNSNNSVINPTEQVDPNNNKPIE
jgi:hypothetical protein